MDPELETIDWATIDSVFVEDLKYESFDAPKWVDLASPDKSFDEEAWFCKPACKHPKTLEDFYKSNQNSKVKLLRSISFSEILPFSERNRRYFPERIHIFPDAKQKLTDLISTRAAREKEMKSRINPEEPNSIPESSENKNPNTSTPAPSKNPESLKSKPMKNPTLKSTFSARNLLGGREIVSQITELCSKLTRKSSKKQSPSTCSSSPAEKTERGGILGELKERVRDRDKERKPLFNNGG